MRVLVTGGAGYIGSHTVVELINAGHEAVIVDDLSNAKADVVDRIQTITGVKPAFYEADCKDKDALRKIFSDHKIDAIIHFAAFKAVGESVKKPLQYYRNNLDSTFSLLEVMEEFDCKKFIFSSSATVYGSENSSPYKEEMPAIQSSSPYGWTKVMIERVLKDYVTAHPDFCAVLLRYFNPIGAHASGLLGDDPNGIPNNLMPYIGRVAAGKLEKLTIFGGDYPTPDGTCQRDYLHVVDLAVGHLKALEFAAGHEGVEAINLGTGNGISVLELVHAFNAANNMELPYVIGPRRDGDLPAFWADAEKARTLLGWEAKHTVEDMCRSAWEFAKNN
jgi:UDP-glucose 4-epimerase